METFRLYQDENKKYTCGDIGVSSSEWFGLLNDSHAEPYIETLLFFLRAPKHQSSCSALSEKYHHHPQYFNNKIIAFSKWVQKKLDRFIIAGEEDKDRFWPTAMVRGWEEKGLFIWELRPEVVEALQQYLVEGLIEQYCTACENKPFRDYGETYKWDKINEDVNATTQQIVESMYGFNVVYNTRVDGIFKYLLQNKKEPFLSCVDRLFEESNSLEKRLKNFKSELPTLCPSDWKVFANDERTASALLTCKYPLVYTFYMNDLYQTLCNYLGIKSQKVGEKYIHFMDIVNKLTDKYYPEIHKINKNELDGYALKPKKLEVQTMLWCMKEKMEKDINPDVMKNTYFDKMVKTWKKFKNIILYGAPGTGKTYDVPEYVVRLCEPDFDSNNATREEIMEHYNQLKTDNRVRFTTFHQSMDYEEWIEGLQPKVDENDQVIYKHMDGIFKKLCNEVKDDLPYVMVIDELNRGNVSKIFGETITLLEPSKRKGSKMNGESVILPYSQLPFQIPDNVYVIATMNTADRSLDTLDYAIRRRFAFIPCLPYKPALEDGFKFEEDLFKKVSELFISNYEEYKNSGWNPNFRFEPAGTLSEGVDPRDVWIGHSYFILEESESIEDNMLYTIIPLLEEYVRDGILTLDAQNTIDELYDKINA